MGKDRDSEKGKSGGNDYFPPKPEDRSNGYNKKNGEETVHRSPPPKEKR